MVTPTATPAPVMVTPTATPTVKPTCQPTVYPTKTLDQQIENVDAGIDVFTKQRSLYEEYKSGTKVSSPPKTEREIDDMINYCNESIGDLQKYREELVAKKSGNRL